MDFDFDRIRAQLESVAEADSVLADEVQAWLEQSWRTPTLFFCELARHHARLSSPAPKSHPSEGFDFYYDLVLRHRPERVALRSYSRQGGWRSLSFGDLDARSTALADEWAQRGLGPGAAVCLILPLGDDFVVALLTALRLGLKVSLLPPLGARFVSTRLAALAGATVVTTPTYLPLVADGARALLVSDVIGARATARRLLYTYAPDATVATLFSEHVEPVEVPLPLRADHLYLGALRDGLIMLSLRPGDLVAAPGMSFLPHQPTLLLGALLCGATFVHVDPSDIAADPLLITQLPLRSIGITTELRDVLLRARATGTRGWSHWFRNPEEPLDPDAWRRFITSLKLENVPTSNLLVDASAGGSVLWSLRRRGQVHAEVLPAVARPWSLASPTAVTVAGAAAGPPALGDFGLFAARAPERPPYMLLVRAGSQFLYGGTKGPRIGGRVYPGAEVVAAALTVPAVIAAAVVLDRAGRLGQPVRILIAFTGAVRAGEAEARAITTKITQALGADMVPDRLELVPLYPRRDADGALARRWCETEQLTGMLHYKPRHPVFQTLTLLRRALQSDVTRRR
jgi:hypothetical protein